MAKTASASDQLRKGSKVVATEDLRDVPEGTEGKVVMVTGLTWIRYWVRFKNGVALGSIARHKIATKAELLARAQGDWVDEAEEAEGDDAVAGGDADAAAGVTTPAGTFVPQKFIDRAAAARARLSA